MRLAGIPPIEEDQNILDLRVLILSMRPDAFSAPLEPLAKNRLAGRVNRFAADDKPSSRFGDVLDWTAYGFSGSRARKFDDLQFGKEGVFR